MRVKRTSNGSSTRVERLKGDKQPTRKYSSKQEESVAKTLNGCVQKNSGATPFAKGDIALDDFLVECKTKMSDSQSISIKKEWLEKIEKESLFMGKPYYSLVFNFGPNSRNYYIVDETMFQMIVDKSKWKN